MASWLENELAKILPIGKGEDNGNTTIRRVFARYSDLPFNSLRFLQEKLRGSTTLVSETGLIKRFLPWKDPDQPNLRVTRVDFQGHGYGKTRVGAVDPNVPMTTAIAVQRWLLTVSYSTLPYDTGEGVPFGAVNANDPPYILGNSTTDETTRYATKIVRPGLHFATPPVGSIYLDQAGRPRIPLGIPVPIIVPESQIEVTWYNLCDGIYPFSAIEACRGRVNSTTMRLPPGREGKGTYDPETLALDGVREVPMWFPDGSKGCHLVFAFFYRGGNGNAGETINLNTLPDPQGVWRKAYRGQATSITDSIFAMAKTPAASSAFDYLFKSQRKWSLDFP